jgi:hypothetical protein
VYRATDTRLKRQVAIKVLPPSLAADADRLARFQREGTTPDNRQGSCPKGPRWRPVYQGELEERRAHRLRLWVGRLLRPASKVSSRHCHHPLLQPERKILGPFRDAFATSQR